MEDGGDATTIDHSNFRTSNIKVSAGPVKGKNFRAWAVRRGSRTSEFMTITEIVFSLNKRKNLRLETNRQQMQHPQVLKLVRSLIQASRQHHDDFKMTVG